MLRSVFLKTVRDQRRALVWWSLGLVATVALLFGMYPTIRDSASQLTQYIQNMPAALRSIFGGEDYATPTGYLRSELFSFMLPLVFLIFTVGAGSRAIAGEEEEGTLDVLLASPIPRSRVLLEKVAAMVTTTLVLAIVLVVSLVVGVTVSDMGIPVGHLVAQVASMTLLALALGSLSLAIGCLTGSRAVANGVTGAVAVATYLVDALAASVKALEPYQWLSPFHYYAAHDPIAHGLSAVHASALAAVAVVLIGVALIAFERRDLAA